MFWGDVKEVWRKESKEHPKLEMIRMLIEKQANSACTMAQSLTLIYMAFVLLTII